MVWHYNAAIYWYFKGSSMWGNWSESLLTVPPHCNRFQMVLDMMETLNTRRKRSALVKEGGHVLLQHPFFFPSWQSKLCWELIPQLTLQADTVTYAWGKWLSVWSRPSLSSWLESVPAQGHRFQMVLDEILYSKTPSETSSLGRMPLEKQRTLSATTCSVKQTRKYFQIRQYAFSQQSYTNTIHLSNNSGLFYQWVNLICWNECNQICTNFIGH